MFYISRILSKSRVGVVDSEDGTEDILSGAELIHCLRDLGMSIEGAHLVKRRGRIHVAAEAYQPGETVTVFQTKSKMLKCVDVKVNNGVITSIRWGSESTPFSIRLSDFGTRCADYLFWWSAVSAAPWLTFVFDDSISITGKSLKNIGDIGIKSDLREVTNDKLAEVVYKAYSSSRYTRWNKIEQLIIDNEERKNFWRAVHYISHWDGGFAGLQNSDIFKDEKIVAKLTKRFGSEFKTIAKANVAFDYNNEEFRRQALFYIRDILSLSPMWDGVDDIDDLIVGVYFRTMKDRCSPRMFNLLSRFSNLDRGVVSRFSYFLYYVSDVSKDIQRPFVELCLQVTKQLYEDYLEGNLE